MKKAFILLVSFLFLKFPQAKEVTFWGIDKSHRQTRLSISIWHPTFDGDYPILKPVIGQATYLNDSVFEIKLNVDGPVSATFSLLPEKQRTHYQTGWITPGDSLNIAIDPSDPLMPIRFTGNRAIHYNLYREYALFLKDHPFAQISTIGAFLERQSLLWAKMDSILLTALQEDTIDRDFPNIFATEMKVHSLFLLEILKRKIEPLTAEDSVAIAHYVVEHAPSVIPPELLTSREFTLGLAQYVFLNRSDALSDEEKYLHDNRFVLERFSGKVKDYLLANLTRHYAKNPNVSVSREVYLDQSQLIVDNITDSLYRQWAMDNVMSLEKLNRPLPTALLQELVLDPDGLETTIEQVLASYKGKTIVLDLWASWCGPCIYEFKEGKEQVSKWKDKNVAFVYLSIDKPKDYDAMREIADQHGFSANNYVLQDISHSPLYDYLNLAASGIPRYVILDRQGNLKWMNAYRPSNKALFDEQLLKYTKTEVTY